MELKFRVHHVGEFKVTKTVQHEGVSVPAVLTGLEVELVSVLDNCSTYVHRVITPEAVAEAKSLFVQGATVVFNIAGDVVKTVVTDVENKI